MTSWRPQGEPWAALPEDLDAFWAERHLLTLTTLRADGSPHVVPVGVVLDPERACAWVITSRGSRKARNLQERPGSPVAACQVDGRRWATLEGTATVTADVADVARAELLYAARYRQPRPNPERVALQVQVDRILHSRTLTAG